MTTIASLGVEINSQSVVRATDDLDRLVDSGKGAEDSAKRVESAWQRAVSGISSDTSQIVKELQQLNARQDSTAQLMAKLAQSVNQASSAFTSASTAAEKTATAEAKVAESAEQAKARMLALATAAIDAAKGQQQLSGALDTTAAAAGEAARKQLDQLATQRRVAQAAADSVVAQDKATSSTKKAATATAEDANALAKLIGQIDPAVSALKRLDAQQDLLGRSKELGLLSKEDFSRYTASIDQTREGLTRFQGDLNKTGVSAKQNAAALRTLPAQFTDIFTSLQGGQAPLTVLLQQGGQIKDSFGGIGAAANALGGYVLGLINPLTVAGVALTAIAYGAYQGSKEFTEYQKALTQTGGSAGLSAGQLNALAESIGRSNGTVGLAAEALGELAATGKIAGESFDEIAVAAVAMNQATGKAVQDTIAEFVKIADDPVSAAKTLNESYGFLTASVYEQIVSLKEQGKEQDAVKLLTDTYASTVKSRAGQIVEDLGYVETAWKAVKTMTLGAIDGLKEFGRQKTIQSQIDQLDSQIASMKAIEDLASKQVGLSDEQLKRYKESAGYDAEKVKSWTVQRGFLQDQLDSQSAIAKAQGNAQEREKASINAIDSLHTSYLAGLDKESKKKLDIAELDRKRAEALKGEGVNVAQINKEYDVSLKAINDRYKDAKVAAPAVDLTGFNDAENALKSLDAAYQNSVRVLDASLKSGLVSQEQYTLQKLALIDKEKTDVEAAYNAEIAALQAVRDKATTTGAQRIGIDQKIADARQKQTDALKKLDTDQDVLSKQTKGRLEQEEAAYKAFAQTVSDSLALAQRGLDQQLAGFGLGERARQQLQQDLQIREDYQRKLEQLTRDYNKIDNPTNGQKSNFERETQLLQSALDERLAKQQKYYQDVDTLRSDWMNGASRAFANYIDETKDVAGQTEGLFSDALHGVEDAFVNAATTGKLSFKDLADSIIADLARIVAKAYVVTPIIAALGIGGDPAGGGTGVGVGAGSIFGGGGLGGALSNISSVVSVAGSKFGESVLAGWNGSEGVLGGLQNAFGNGADYIKSAITSGFTSGSATAASVASNFAASSAAGASQAGYTGTAFQNFVAGQNASTSLASLSSVLSYIGAAYSVLTSFQQYGVKGAATTAGFAGAGALVGSFVGPIGTAAGAAIGSVLGSFVSGKLFGGSGEKYPDLSTSATGRYINGQYTDTGIVQGWQTNAPKFGQAADAQLSSTLNQFSATLGKLYDVLGNGGDVVAYNTLQVRKTSGKYSTTFGTRLDDGSVLEDRQLFNAADAAAALTENYDNILGTFLAKAIVSSKSLPDYFKAQFTQFASDWNVTADQVIKTIEGVFTRFNGVNDALSLINIDNLKLNDTGLQASDAILNMIGAMGGLDTATASAKDKVDALNKSVTTYYQAFFSADEQFADLTKNLQNALGNLGVKLPDTRAAYRQMVEDIDVTTAAGQAMFATLVGLATNADSYYSGLEQKSKDAEQAATQAQQAAADAAQKIIDGLLGNVTSAQSAVERAINAQKASVNDMLETANQQVGDLTTVSNSLGSALKSLRGDSDSAVKVLRQQAQATLQAALAQARAGKSLAGFGGLEDALGVVTSNTTDLYSSLEDFNRDQGRTANVVAELEKLNGKQLTSAQQTARTLQDQLDALDDQLEFAQSQLDALNGVDNSVKSVAQAVKEMNAAVVAALAGIGGKGSTATNNGTLIDTIYKDVLGRNGADQAGKDYWLGELANGHLTLDQLAQAIANAAKQSGATVKAGYATGGYISGPGTGTSDSIPAWLSNGEFVMSAAAVRTFGTDTLDRMNNLQMPKFASGGAVMNVASPIVVGSQRARPGNDAGDTTEVLRQLNRRLGNLETYMDSASRDLRQINNAGVQVVGTVSTKEVAA
ncbi:phage tail tape measure protein [Pseudomonas sp. SLFW]|uniref:phage tail tape measure protein n=1 Tax=Pseudomonas sp. SLFW TaxID=2683259 RepID=UPI001411E85A|nr:phage tail tape measure protein [Pseudomonas sp. SLFW]NBB11828.1 phage tail tape measure protein [Pseudomonas sp. SLFW]